MNVSIDESYRLLAARHFRRQAKRLAGQLDGVRKAEDTEYVHRARIASRRLRAGLRVFADCLPPRTLRRWRSAIRRVTSGLGTARDKDVQIEYFSAQLADLRDEACCRGVARLLVQLEQERWQCQREVIAAVDRFEASGTLQEMRRMAKAVLGRAKTHRVSVQSACVYRRAEEHIVDGVARLLRYRDSLKDPKDQEQHHAMRIAAKRLRYTIELLRPVYDGRLDDSLLTVKKLQLMLGDVHDCDVRIRHLRQFKRKKPKPAVKHFGNPGSFSHLKTGINYLIKQCRKQRKCVFRELVDCWGELEAHRTWKGLVRTVEAAGRPAVESAAVGMSCSITNTPV